MSVPAAWAILRAGYEKWAASPAWTITQIEDGVESVAGAVRPGLQWIADGATGQHQVLVKGDSAYVRGAMNLLGVAGWGTDPERIERAVGNRWVHLPTRMWLREHDHSALGWFGKGLGDNPDSYYVEHLDTASSGDAMAVRLKTDQGVLLVRRAADGDWRFVECVARSGATLIWDFEDTPLQLPDPEQDVMSQPEILLALGRKPRRQAAMRRPPTLRVTAPDEPADRWCVRSSNLARALGVAAGYEAESLALQAVAQRQPDLLPDIEGDSYDTVFCVYVSDEKTANALAAVLRDIANDS